jgi:sugar phosphate permease
MSNGRTAPRYRWAVLAAGTAAQAGFSTISFAVAVLAPALRERYDLSLTEIGVVLSAEWIGLTFAMLPWGFAADRFGERVTLAVGLASCSAFLAAAAFAPDFGTLVAMLTLAGVAGGSVQSGSGRAVMRWFGAHERGLALGVRQTAVPLGGFAAAVVVPLLDDTREGFLFLSAVVLVGAIAGAVVLRSRPDSELPETAEIEATLRDRRLLLVCGVSGAYVVAQAILMGFLVLFLHDDRGFSTRTAAAALAVSQVVAAGLRLAVGRWSDVTRSRVRPLRIVGATMAVSIALVAVTANAAGWLAAAAVVVATAVSMAWNGLSFTIAAELGGRRSGAAIGLQQTVLSASGVGAPVAFAALVSWTSWQAAFAVAALFPLAGRLLLQRLDEPPT